MVIYFTVETHGKPENIIIDDIKAILRCICSQSIGIVTYIRILKFTGDIPGIPGKPQVWKYF
jgi:hypothetical protein